MQTACPQLPPPATAILQALTDSNLPAFPFLTNLVISKHKSLPNLRQKGRKEVEGRRKGKPGSWQLSPPLPLLHPSGEAMEWRCWAERMLFSCGGAVKLSSHLLGSREAHAWAGIANPLASPEHLLDLAGRSQPAPRPRSPSDALRLPSSPPPGLSRRACSAVSAKLHLASSPGVVSDNLWCMEAWSNVRENAIGIKGLRGRQNIFSQ